MPDTGQQRIGDAERERAVSRLGEHVGAGRIDLAEFEERSGRVYAAHTRAELDDLFADLPSSRPSRPGRRRRAHRIVMTAMWGPWLLSSAVCVAIWTMVVLADGTAGYFWPIWVIGPWGLALAVGSVTGGRACGSRHAHRPA